MPYVDFLRDLHTRTKRDYLGRVLECPKARAAEVARRFDHEYWDGDRRFGYGGMTYDGRWRPVAEALAQHYGLGAGDRVLDVGCGKAFLLYDLMRAVPGLEVRGIDISPYAVSHAPEDVRPMLAVAHAGSLPFENDSFDLVVSLTTLHNLYCYDLDRALREIQRVARPSGGKNIVVESYRNEQEKTNLLYWQLTCECFFTPEEWNWWFQHCGYDGDHSFIYFE